MSSGYGRRLKVVGSNPGTIYWMDITFFTLICCKNCFFLKKTENKRKRGIFKKSPILILGGLFTQIEAKRLKIFERCQEITSLKITKLSNKKILQNCNLLD